MAADWRNLIEGMAHAAQWLARADAYLEREYSPDMTVAEESGHIVARKLLTHCGSLLLDAAQKQLFDGVKIGDKPN